MSKRLSGASHELPGKLPAPWQEEQLPGFPASLHSRKQEAGSKLPGAHPRKLTINFTATTCRKCGAIVLAGIADGILRKLEPRVLDDLTEYQALADGVPTYNLHPDRQVTRRGYAHIIADTRHPRLPAHVCGKSYASLPLPTPPRPPVKGDEPEF